MKSKKATHSKKKDKRGRKKGSKDKIPRVKSTDGIKPGLLFVLQPNFFDRIKERLYESAKGGQPMAFKTPGMMLEAMEEYVKWAMDNPLMTTQVAMGGLIEVPVRRPITIAGYCLFCGVVESYLRSFESQQKDRKPEFIAVIKTIKEFINDDLFSGAAAGQFNANLISKKLGLAESINMNHGIQPEQVAALFPFKRPEGDNVKQLE